MPNSTSARGTRLNAALDWRMTGVRYGPAVLVSDLRHFLDLPDDMPAPALRLAAQLRDIVRAATAGDQGGGSVSALPCRRRPGNRRCQGRIFVRRTDGRAAIGWACIECPDEGFVDGWQDTPYDLSAARVGSAPTAMDTVVSDEVVATLRGSLLLDADGERVVYRARTHHGQVVLSAADDQVDELLGYLAAEADHETNRRRRQRLDAAFDELSHAARRRADPTTVCGTRRTREVGTPARGPRRRPHTPVYKTCTWHGSSGGAPRASRNRPVTRSGSSARSGHDT